LYGIFEVFVDTILICTTTALVILVTGTWDSGATGAAPMGPASRAAPAAASRKRMAKSSSYACGAPSRLAIAEVQYALALASHGCSATERS
jgi:Na+/alanine symporter